jgi:hypothetical protein
VGPVSQNPPMSPGVQAQQAPDMSQYASGLGGGQGAPGASGQSQDPSGDFLKQQMQQLATVLDQVVQVASQSKPSIMPLLRKIAEAGQMIMSELQNSGSPGAGPGPGAGSQSGAQSPQQMPLGQ